MHILAITRLPYRSVTEQEMGLHDPSAFPAKVQWVPCMQSLQVERWYTDYWMKQLGQSARGLSVPAASHSSSKQHAVYSMG
jgi:hypothetical protein